MKKFTILLIVIITILLSTFFILKSKKSIETISEATDENESSEYEELPEPLEWHGKYIWCTTNTNNTWACFRKK